MEYLSTRSSTYFVDSAQAVLNGLAPDGGLYVPRGLPQLDVAACLKEDTMQMASRIIGALLPDIPDMDGLVKKAYVGKFQTEELTPTVDTGKFTVLELFRGIFTVEKGHRQPCGVIPDLHLGQIQSLADMVGSGGVHHHRLEAGRHIHLQLGDGAQLRAIFISSGKMADQITQGKDIQIGKLLRLGRPNTF